MIKLNSNILLLLSFSLVLLMGCKSTLHVKGNFPTPVINQLPYRVGVIFPEEFSNFRYVEQNEKRSEWEITLGSAQVQLVSSVLNAMFDKVILKNNINEALDKDVDLYFLPTVEKFQYNIPYETKGRMYEVWLKYNMKIFDNKGQLVADWILTAYGKTPSAFFKSNEEALNEATIIALRDLGAGLAIRFTHVPEIANWLDKQKTMANKRSQQQVNSREMASDSP